MARKKKIPRPSAETVTVLPMPEELAARLYIELYTSPSIKRRRALLRKIQAADDGITFVVEQIRTGMLKVEK